LPAFDSNQQRRSNRLHSSAIYGATKTLNLVSLT